MPKLHQKVLLATTLFLFSPFLVKASCSQNTNLDVVVRDASGAFITNATVQVYKQEPDANGDPKPTTRFASVTTNQNLGIAHLSWRNTLDSDQYALKVQTINKDNAAFWFYNLSYDCGGSYDFSGTLSGINLVLHDANGALLTNTNFNIYSQLYDSNNRPLKQTKELLVSANSGTGGQAKLYLPQGSVRSLDGAISDDYTLELSRNNFKFRLYNIHVADGQTTSVSYYLSALQAKLKDITGALFPSGTNVEIFQQEVDSDNNPTVGTKVGQFTLGTGGTGTIELPADLYVLGVKGQNNQYQYFWDVDVLDGRLNEYELTSSQNWLPSGNGCPNSSRLTISLRSYGGSLAAGLKYTLYEQTTDANGLPAVGSSVNSGTINNSGQALVNFNPDPRKIYAIKVWDKRADRGEFWFFNAVRFVCGYDRQVTKYVPSLKIVLRDEAGNLKKNYSFSLYAQDYDADGNPYFQDSNLIANLQTGEGGYALVYVAPYNPYRSGQTGFYAISAKDGSGNTVRVYNIKVNEADSTFNYAFNGLSGQLLSALKKPLTNKEVRLYEQIKEGGEYSLGRQLAKANTDSSGRFRFEYSGGLYALATNDDFSQSNIFWNARVSSASVGAQNLVTNLTRFSLSSTEGVVTSNPAFNLYSLSSSDGRTYYRDRQIGSISLGAGRTASRSLAAGAYLATYNAGNNREFGVAFRATNGGVQDVKIVINQKYLINGAQSFSLSASTPSNVTSQSSGNAVNGSALSRRLAGRILLQTQDKGQAWYLNPTDQKRYFLGRPADAFNLMRRFGLGISNADFNKLEKSANRSLAGRILIKTQDSGRAYYYDPVNLKLYYLGRPTDAYNIIRSRGLGISNSDLGQITIGL